MAIILATLILSCAGTGSKLDKNEEKALREGNYSLIIIGDETGKPEMAVMDPEGDKYEIESTEDTEGSRTSGLTRTEAIIKADESLPGSGVTLKAVRDEQHGIIGYEVYPIGAALDPDDEGKYLPNLLSIKYGKDPSGKRKLRLRILPLKPKPDID